ncbi:hypothetical protein F9278_28895 [Streptomyces phaeolivaceus]|uniref:CPBP family intramembrane metalloprotease n=1 Tax=Streptomyces phaeolivaceus TaxID=2653200 RepID=A0A5P8K8Y6_9ACTN|nr:hypothetical protein [Streptomyces phaeolivaceus]QFQ99504.1 hypothetical protein F9278_28895 [Streptomyces phaeolivaceus]
MAWIDNPHSEPPPTHFVGLGVIFVQARLTAGAMASVTALYFLGSIWIDQPFGFWEVWRIPNDVLGGIAGTWYLLVWGLAVTLLFSVIAIVQGIPRLLPPGTAVGLGLWDSVNAGFFEELRFRWLFLLSAPPGLALLNLITFGLVEWLYTVVLVPLADTVTLGILAPQLTGSEWLVGAAIVSVNGGFRASHNDQRGLAGIFRLVNSWFIGMLLFYLLFNYGLWAAITVHILYDIVVFTTAALMSVFRHPLYGMVGSW